MTPIARAVKATLARPAREVSPHGLAFIQHSEGLPGTGGKPALTAYQDSKGVWTIGWGHTRGVYAGQTCTEAQAIAWLDVDLDDAENGVARFVTVPLNANQFDALVSFVFNVGTVQFMGSALLRKLNTGDYGAVVIELARWNKITWLDAAGKKQSRVVPGLTNRRAGEAELWLVPVDDMPTINASLLPPDLSLDTTITVPAPPLVQTAGVVLAGEVPTAPPTSVAATPGGKTGIAALIAGASGVIAEGYNQVEPIIFAMRRIAYGLGTTGTFMQVAGAVLALASVSALAWSLWRKRKELKGA